MATLSGGCLCGAIRFEADGDASIVTNCHCSMCRRSSGAAFLSYAAYASADVRFTKGKPAEYRSSPDASRGFCANCGGALSFFYHVEPEKIWLTLGSFDDPAAHRPAEDWYAGVKLPWVRLDDHLKHWPGPPEWVAETTGRSED